MLVGIEVYVSLDKGSSSGMGKEGVGQYTMLPIKWLAVTVVSTSEAQDYISRLAKLHPELKSSSRLPEI